MTSDHDQRFKLLLKEFLPEFFQLFFPEWAKQFEFDQTEWLDTEAFSDPPQGDRRMLDLVAKLKRTEPEKSKSNSKKDSSKWLSLIHIEVESAASIAPLRKRMHRYYTDLRQRHNLPVLPVAIYLKVGLDGIGIDEYHESFNSFEILHFRYLYVGLPHLDSVKYSKENNILSSALAGLMKTPSGLKPRRKADAFEEISVSDYNDFQKYLLLECLEAYFDLKRPQQKEFEQLLDTEEYQGAKKMAITTHEKGIQKGIQEGVQKGVQEGQRDLILRMLEERFGIVDEQIKQKLYKWHGDYSVLVSRILNADSIADVDLQKNKK